MLSPDAQVHPASAVVFAWPDCLYGVERRRFRLGMAPADGVDVLRAQLRALTTQHLVSKAARGLLAIGLPHARARSRTTGRLGLGMRDGGGGI